MEGGFSASLHLYISIAKRPSLAILPDVHMYKAVPSIKPGVPYIQTKWNKSWTGNSKIEKVMTCHPFVIKTKKKINLNF
jgi:hypothetical protein